MLLSYQMITESRAVSYWLTYVKYLQEEWGKGSFFLSFLFLTEFCMFVSTISQNIWVVSATLVKRLRIKGLVSCWLTDIKYLREEWGKGSLFSFLSFCYGILWADQDKDHEGTNNAHWYQAKLRKRRKERVIFLLGISS